MHVMGKFEFLIIYMSILKLWVRIELMVVGIMGMFKAYLGMLKEGPKAGKGRDQREGTSLKKCKRGDKKDS